jgi:hypothetical protein
MRLYITSIHNFMPRVTHYADFTNMSRTLLHHAAAAGLAQLAQSNYRRDTPGLVIVADTLIITDMKNCYYRR